MLARSCGRHSDGPFCEVNAQGQQSPAMELTFFSNREEKYASLTLKTLSKNADIRKWELMVVFTVAEEKLI